MSSRIVITGGAGFLGTLLARRLLGEPVVLGGAAPAAWPSWSWSTWSRRRPTSAPTAACGP